MKIKKSLFKYLILAVVFFISSLLIYKFNENQKTVEINYNEQQTIDYKVYLTDATFYGTKYLDEGMQYISSIIDYIDVDFSYKVLFENKIDYEIDTKILADIKIVDKNNEEKVIYNSQETLVGENNSTDDSNVIDIAKNLKIDYKKYNKIANEFKTNYGISANCSLIVNFYIDYKGKYKKFDSIENSSIGSLEIPLSEQMININKTNDINNSSVYKFINKELMSIKILSIISVVLYVLCIFMLIMFLVKLIKFNNTKNKYEKYINKILRQYDSYITESKVNIDENGKTIIKCSSFKELMDVRNNIEKAIVYVKINQKKSKFILIDNNEIYSYQVNSEDF